MRSNRRRCYCNRLYPGFVCAYCRMDAYIADEERIDPLLAQRSRESDYDGGPETESAAPAKRESLWTKVAARGRALFRGKSDGQT